MYQEIKDVIAAVDANGCRTKRSREKTMPGKRLFSPKALNKEFARFFNAAGWNESRYNYYCRVIHN